MWRPRKLANGIIMSDHDCLGALAGSTNVKGADGSVHAGSRQDRGTVLVPVVGQTFGRGRGSGRSPGGARDGGNGGGMDGNLHNEVVRGRCRSTEVKQADIRVGCHAGEDVGRMGGESGGVGAAVSREGDEGVRTFRRPDAHGAIPAARAEAVLCNQVPVHAEDFAVVLFPVLHGEVVQVAIKELHTTITRASQNLVLIDLRPRKIIEGILGGEPAGYERSVSRGISEARCTTEPLPFHRHNAIWGQFKDKQASISNQTKIGRRCDRQLIVEEGRVFDRAAVEALGSEAEHGSLAAKGREEHHGKGMGE